MKTSPPVQPDTPAVPVFSWDAPPEAPEMTEERTGRAGDMEPRRCSRCADEVTARCLRRTTAHVYRRASSESKLLDIMDRDFVPGQSFHVMSAGDVDSLSFLKHIVRQQALRYCLFSTWCMADDDVLQFREWIVAGKIARLDCYVGEIFPGSYPNPYKLLKDVLTIRPGGRICIARNHSKVYAGIGDKFAFSIESSANINTNPRMENTTVTCGVDAFAFHKAWFDGIKSFARDYDDWKPWTDQAL